MDNGGHLINRVLFFVTLELNFVSCIGSNWVTQVEMKCEERVHSVFLSEMRRADVTVLISQLSFSLQTRRGTLPSLSSSTLRIPPNSRRILPGSVLNMFIQGESSQCFAISVEVP